MPHRHAATDPGWRAIRAAFPAEKRGPAHGRVTFLGHSTLLLEVDDLRILTDPLLRDGMGPVRRQVKAVLPELFADLDAVFLSHGHHDHLDLPSLRAIPGRPTVIVPKGFGAMVSSEVAGPVEEVEPGDRLTIDRVHFEVTAAEHSGKREPLGPVGPAIGCVIRGSRHIYFPGDTDLFPGLEPLAGTLDLALLPGLAVPIHWGTFYPAGLRRVKPEPLALPGPQFLEAAARLAPDVVVRILAPGESIELDRPGG